MVAVRNSVSYSSCDKNKRVGQEFELTPRLSHSETHVASTPRQQAAADLLLGAVVPASVRPNIVARQVGQGPAAGYTSATNVRLQQEVMNVLRAEREQIFTVISTGQEFIEEALGSPEGPNISQTGFIMLMHLLHQFVLDQYFIHSLGNQETERARTLLTTRSLRQYAVIARRVRQRCRPAAFRIAVPAYAVLPTAADRHIIKCPVHSTVYRGMSGTKPLDTETNVGVMSNSELAPMDVTHFRMGHVGRNPPNGNNAMFNTEPEAMHMTYSIPNSQLASDTDTVFNNLAILAPHSLPTQQSAQHAPTICDAADSADNRRESPYSNAVIFGAAFSYVPYSFEELAEDARTHTRNEQVPRFGDETGFGIAAEFNVGTSFMVEGEFQIASGRESSGFEHEADCVQRTGFKTEPEWFETEPERVPDSPEIFGEDPEGYQFNYEGFKTDPQGFGTGSDEFETEPKGLQLEPERFQFESERSEFESDVPQRFETAPERLESATGGSGAKRERFNVGFKTSETMPERSETGRVNIKVEPEGSEAESEGFAFEPKRFDMESKTFNTKTQGFETGLGVFKVGPQGFETRSRRLKTETELKEFQTKPERLSIEEFEIELHGSRTETEGLESEPEQYEDEFESEEFEIESNGIQTGAEVIKNEPEEFESEPDMFQFLPERFETSERLEMEPEGFVLQGFNSVPQGFETGPERFNIDSERFNIESEGVESDGFHTEAEVIKNEPEEFESEPEMFQTVPERSETIPKRFEIEPEGFESEGFEFEEFESESEFEIESQKCKIEPEQFESEPEMSNTVSEGFGSNTNIFGNEPNGIHTDPTGFNIESERFESEPEQYKTEAEEFEIESGGFAIKPEEPKRFEAESKGAAVEPERFEIESQGFKATFDTQFQTQSRKLEQFEAEPERSEIKSSRSETEPVRSEPEHEGFRPESEDEDRAENVDSNEAVRYDTCDVMLRPCYVRLIRLDAAAVRSELPITPATFVPATSASTPTSTASYGSALTVTHVVADTPIAAPQLRRSKRKLVRDNKEESGTPLKQVCHPR